MDSDLEQRVHTFQACYLNQKMPRSTPMHPWEWPPRPWSHIHIEYAGPMEGEMLLIVVDAQSKWLETHITLSSTAGTTISTPRKILATLGCPEVVVTDSSPAFISAEFQQFLSRNEVRHVHSSPYHPSSNRLAERAVQTVKTAVLGN